MTKVLSTQKSIPQSCTSNGFSSMYKLTRLQPHWGEEEQRLVGTRSWVAAPRSPEQPGPALLARCGPSHSPEVMNCICYRSLTEASNQPQAMCQLPLPTASALLPAPFPGTLGLPQTSTRCFSFCTRSSGTGCAFPCLLRHFWSPQQPGYRITR